MNEISTQVAFDDAAYRLVEGAPGSLYGPGGGEPWQVRCGAYRLVGGAPGSLYGPGGGEPWQVRWRTGGVEGSATAIKKNMRASKTTRVPLKKHSCPPPLTPLCRGV